MILYSGEIYIHAKNDGINTAIKNKKEIINNVENFNYNSNILIYDGKINIIYNNNGFDSNGDIEFLGGDISLIQGKQGDEPVECSWVFKLSESSLISIGNKSTINLNEIIKGNQKYADYNEYIKYNKILKIENVNKEVIKSICILYF